LKTDKNTKYFIDSMNSTLFGGYGDWRMPNIKELGSLITCNIPGQNIDDKYFPNTQSLPSSSYWSSTTYAGHSDYVWDVEFDYGHDEYHAKYNGNYVRAVRGGQSESLIGASTAGNIYVDNNDGTVTDVSTGLMWQQTGPSNEMNWEQALSYCEGLNLGGYSDWRLPAKKVLRSLVDFSRIDPAIDTIYFPDTDVMSIYWSSTTNSNMTDYAWGAYFIVGYDSSSDKSHYGFVRAVRGGQATTQSGCLATINANLLLNIPYITYSNPILGTLSLLADFVYEFNPTYPTLIIFKLSNADIIVNPSNLCTASTITYDLNIHIPDVLLPNGIDHLWVDLKYSAALSTDGNAYFVASEYGQISD
jgi:hypothetical protein